MLYKNLYGQLLLPKFKKSKVPSVTQCTALAAPFAAAFLQGENFCDHYMLFFPENIQQKSHLSVAFHFILIE